MQFANYENLGFQSFLHRSMQTYQFMNYFKVYNDVRSKLNPSRSFLNVDIIQNWTHGSPTELDHCTCLHNINSWIPCRFTHRSFTNIWFTAIAKTQCARALSKRSIFAMNTGRLIYNRIPNSKQKLYRI